MAVNPESSIAPPDSDDDTPLVSLILATDKSPFQITQQPLKLGEGGNREQIQEVSSYPGWKSQDTGKRAGQES